MRGTGADGVATYKISGILKQSTGVMRDVNSLVKIPELNRDMRQFSMELTKVRHYSPE